MCTVQTERIEQVLQPTIMEQRGPRGSKTERKLILTVGITCGLPWRGACPKRLFFELYCAHFAGNFWTTTIAISIISASTYVIIQASSVACVLFVARRKKLNEVWRNGRCPVPLSKGAPSRQSTASRADREHEFQLRPGSTVTPPPQRKETELGRDGQDIRVTVALGE